MDDPIVQLQSTPQTRRGVVVDEFFSSYSGSGLNAPGALIATGPGVAGNLVVVSGPGGGTVVKLYDNTVVGGTVLFQITLPDSSIYTFPLFLRFTIGLYLAVSVVASGNINLSYRQ